MYESFSKDLMFGQFAEALCLHWLSKVKPEQAVEHKDNADWDFRYGSITVETKWDRRAADTGNLCFEACKADSRPSGTSACHADVWMHVAANYLFVMEFPGLKAYVEQRPINRRTGNQRDYLRLIPIGEVARQPFVRCIIPVNEALLMAAFEVWCIGKLSERALPIVFDAALSPK